MKRTISLLTFLVALQSLVAQNTFQNAFENRAQSSKKNIRIEFSDDQGNSEQLPISIITGKFKGPVFTIVAGVHGFEYPPIIATQEILKEIDVEKLQGTLIIIPIANRASFFSRTPYENPQDQKNLNRIFPGKEKGSITEQIAYFIAKKIIPASDVVLDIHGGDAPEDLLPFVCYYVNEKKPNQTAKAKRLSVNSGFEYVVSYKYTISDTEPAKYLFKQAVQSGKTALSIESGKLGNVQVDNVKLIKKGVLNMLGEMRMYNKGTGAHKSTVYLNGQTYIRSKTTGIFYSSFKAGDKINKGDLIGYTTDEFGIKLEEYKADKSGIVLYMLGTPPINAGDTVMCIGFLKE